MLKTFGWVLKIGMFAGLILVAGQLIQWQGKTVSDQVRIQLSHAENSPTAKKAKSWVGYLLEDSKKIIDRKPTESSHSGSTEGTKRNRKKERSANESDPSSDEFSQHEQRELRDLIQEYNSPKPTARGSAPGSTRPE